MNEKFIFDWGQDVRVILSAPKNLHPDEIGSVCGMRELKGTQLYLIEFSNGQAIEIMEKYLELIKS